MKRLKATLNIVGILYALAPGLAFSAADSTPRAQWCAIVTALRAHLGDEEWVRKGLPTFMGLADPGQALRALGTEVTDLVLRTGHSASPVHSIGFDFREIRVRDGVPPDEVDEAISPAYSGLVGEALFTLTEVASLTHTFAEYSEWTVANREAMIAELGRLNARILDSQRRALHRPCFFTRLLKQASEGRGYGQRSGRVPPKYSTADLHPRLLHSPTASAFLCSFANVGRLPTPEISREFTVPGQPSSEVTWLYFEPEGMSLGIPVRKAALATSTPQALIEQKVEELLHFGGFVRNAYHIITVHIAELQSELAIGTKFEPSKKKPAKPKATPAGQLPIIGQEDPPDSDPAPQFTGTDAAIREAEAGLVRSLMGPWNHVIKYVSVPEQEVLRDLLDSVRDVVETIASRTTPP